jgi:predicted dehydrogenase
MIRYGLLGFGHHCVKRLIPAFPSARVSALTGLWRRDPEKAAANARAY